MSYPGSQQQFGLSDLQLLQQQLMLARLQELQKQQQLGQLGDGKASSSMNNMSLFAKYATGGQIPNLGGGTPFNASNMVAGSNLSWMHHNVTSSMQGITRDPTYSHGEGLLMSPALQQPDISLYGTPAASGQENMKQHSSIQGASHSSVGMLSVNSDEKPIAQVSAYVNSFVGDKHSVPLGHGHYINGSFMLSQGLQEKDSVGQASVQMLNSGIPPQNSLLMKPPQNLSFPPEYNRTGGQPGGTRFLREQTKQTNDSQGTATLDPLEEKILFDTEDSCWDSSFSKLAAIDTAEYVGATGCKENLNAFSSIQSGSWSALMQSAVAAASSSDTGMQEELSGLSFQNTDSSIVKQPSNLVCNEQQHDKWNDSKLQSSSSNLRAARSSGDSMQPKHHYQWSECQRLQNGPISAGHPVNDSGDLNDKNFRDLSQGSRTSGLSMSSVIRSNYGGIQQAVNSPSYIPIHGDTDRKDYKSTGYDHQSSNDPMEVDMLYKRAAEFYGSQNRFRGENSCDSYNSKVSQAYVAKVDLACLNAEDSESSARSSHKSQNQALCISSPKANDQQEYFSHFESTDAKSYSMIKGKSNLSADALSKGSPASDMSASFDSQYTSEHNKTSQFRDHENTVQFGFTVSQTESRELDMPIISVSQGPGILDRFSFQSSVPEDSKLVYSGNEQKCQTWWTPSSFEPSFHPLQGFSQSHNCSGKSNMFEKPVIKTSNIKSERNSLRGLLSSPQHVNHQPDGKHISEASETEARQQMSFSVSSPTQDGYLLKSVSSFGHEYTASGALSLTQSGVTQGMCRQAMMPLNVWKNVPCPKDTRDLSSLNGLPSRSSAVVKDSSESDEHKGPMIETVELHNGHEFAEKYLATSTDASAYAGSSRNQQGYVNSELVQRSSSMTTTRALPTNSQPQLVHNITSSKQQVGIGDDLNKVVYNLSALSNLNKHQIPDVSSQQPLHIMHKLAENLVGSQFDSCIPAFSSGGSSSMREISSRSSALQNVYSQKLPVFAQGYCNGNSIFSDRIRHLQLSAQTESGGYMQNEYRRNKQIPMCDSVAFAPNKPFEIMQLSGNITHLIGTHANRNHGILPSLANQMITREQSLPSSALHPDANENLVLRRSKKRKTAMYDCLPWHKEVMKTSQRLPDISTAEQEWADATNLLIENCFEKVERTEEMRQAVRAKRRLILTTKLMELVFRPPPPTVLSLDATMEYEVVAYSVTKLMLADACSLANWTRTGSDMPHEIGSMDKYCRMADHLSDKATVLFQRIKELESHIERLSKGISVVDIMVECQELEKFSVINHFAKYHSRAPEPVVANSASSSAGMAYVRPFLQKYVCAVPLPQKLPEGAQCLSL